jgi:hypothetical protein
MKSNIKIIVFILFLIPFSVKSQVGGNGVYKFLELTNSARVAGLGGMNVSLNEGDLNFVFHNPAILNADMDNQVIMNYIMYFADIKYGYAGYAFDEKNIGTFSAGIHYVNYGKFIAADQTGQITGDFTAAEYALNLIWSRKISDKLTAGINIKPVISELETYKSYGVASDLGLNYFDREKQLSAGLVFKNIGTEIKPYYDKHYEKLPFDIEMGISKKLAHAPFRINLTAHDLYRWNLLYDLPTANTNNTLDNTQTTQSGNGLSRFLDNGLRHLIIGLELVPVKTFYVSAAYNQKMRKELGLVDKAGTAGFSWGFGVKLKKFSISYGRAVYHAAGASNHFSLGLFLNEFSKKSLEKSST